MSKQFTRSLSATLKPLSLALLAAAAPLAAHAADPLVPNAGSILQEQRQPQPALPSSVDSGLKIEPGSATSLPAGEAFAVKTIQIKGNTAFDDKTLHALVASAEGRDLNLAQLAEQAALISAYYQKNGYPLARAIIPAQVIREGVVTIEIIEARYGKVAATNKSRLRDALVQATLAPLKSGERVSADEMNRALLLLSDIPGLRSSAVLKPGDAVGSSDLLVMVEPGPDFTGSLAANNFGNRYTGRARLNANLNALNLLRQGDVLGLSGTSSGEHLNDARMSYEGLVNGQGTRVGGALSKLQYSLGGALDALGAEGTARVAGGWVRHPLLRSQSTNLYSQIQYEEAKLRDHIQSNSLQTDRHLRNWTLSFTGDTRDTILSGGINSFGLSWTKGRLVFDTPEAALADQASADTAGGFSKWGVTAARLQRLSGRVSMYLAFTGQWAADNLDASMKMSVGGPYSVRAYAPGAISGDRGSFESLELRHELGEWNGQWQALAFVDSAQLTINQSTWQDGANRATLSGAGLGLNWSGPEQLSARVYLATRLGRKPEVLGNAASSHAWAELRWGF